MIDVCIIKLSNIRGMKKQRIIKRIQVAAIIAAGLCWNYSSSLFPDQRTAEKVKTEVKQCSHPENEEESAKVSILPFSIFTMVR